ncbi:MAG: FHA domain-containing protein [Fimbriimonadaceae bacterium]|nr:FHA domain-containing protein [Fimbriimonadaceae bacterium]
MRCPECGQTNVAGSLFCERCGADLSAVQPAADPPPPGWSCPHCDHGNPAANVVCEACGQRPAGSPPPSSPPDPVAEPAGPARLVEAAGVRLPDPAEAIAVATTPGQLATGPRKGKVKLIVEQGMVIGKQYLLTADEMLVGREDASEQFVPDIDLTGLDEGYVHRRHARLTFEGSFLFVTHLGGHNRTFVNNRPIADHLAHPLNVGDAVRFGKVVLRLVEAT